MATEAFAPAKVNLTLHVTGRRADGYHLLDSLVVFADVGDRVCVSDGTGPSLIVSGPEAAGAPPGPDNSVLRAARLMHAEGLSLSLVKLLPAAAGIGGGSSDAAAALRAIAQHLGTGLPDDVLPLGADVPVCLRARATRMSGIGEVLTPVPRLPKLWCVLANPRAPVATADVFARLRQRSNPAMPRDLPEFASAGALAAWLSDQRNDLQGPACAVQPVIGDVLRALGACPAQRLTRMSGSGATCFALFERAAQAAAAAQTVRSSNPGWWVTDAALS